MAFFSSINNISCFASPILTSCTLSNRVSGDVESELQNTAKIISTVKLQSWTHPHFKSRIGKWHVLAFAGLHPRIFFLVGVAGAGGREGEGMGICCSMIFYLAEKAAAFLELGSRCCFIFPFFIGFCYEW